ncbi:MAG: hypothetical protein H0T78_01575, partial [Longispora sp.]|nr:hypothetical protein [Longispora sp. (in: high G+C Gram-positive bacteria)]
TVEGLEDAPPALEAYCIAGRDQHFLVEPVLFVRAKNSDVVTAVKKLTDSFQESSRKKGCTPLSVHWRGDIKGDFLHGAGYSLCPAGK